MAKTTIMRKRGPTSGGSNGTSVPTRQHGGLMACYLGLIARNPLWTKSITTSLLNFAGDIFTQMIVEKSKSLNMRRAASMAIVGLVIVGPALHHWYLFLTKHVKAPGAKGVGMRLIMDQFLFAPIFICVLISSLLLLEGRPNEIKGKLQKDWKSTLIANWKLWIPAQFCNFLFVPPMLQVLFCNVVSLVWNVYLSFVTHNSGGKLGGMKLPQKPPPHQHVHQPRHEHIQAQ